MKRLTFATEWIVPLGLILGVSSLAWVFVYSAMNPVELLTYLRAASAITHGSSPYPHPNGHTLLGGHAYVYPLLVSVLYTPLTIVSVHLATVVSRLGSIIALVAAAGLIKGRTGITVASIALCSTPVLVAIQVGSLEPFLLLGIALAYRFRSRPLISGIILALTSIAKLFLAPLLLWPLIARRRRLSGIAWIATVIVGLGGVLLAPGISTYIEILLHLSHNESASGWSLPGIATNFIHSTRVAEIGVGIIVVMPLCLLLWRRYRIYDGVISEQTLIGLLISLTLMLSPIAWSHYFVLVLFLLLNTKRPTLMIGLCSALSWIVETPDQVSITAVLPAIVVITAVTSLAYRLITDRPTSRVVDPSNRRRLRSPRLPESSTEAVHHFRAFLAPRTISQWVRGNKTVITLLVLGAALALRFPNSLGAIVVQGLMMISLILTISSQGGGVYHDHLESSTLEGDHRDSATSTSIKNGPR
ncbi:MAG: glycosyltransferase family 87 protein [Acidimicrobiales bacterium]